MRSIFAVLVLPAFALAAPVPKEKDESKLLVTSGGTVTMMNPDGTGARVVHKGTNDAFAYTAWLSPDRKRFAFFYKQRPDDRDGKALLGVRSVGGDLIAKVEMRSPDALYWSADGKSLYGTDKDESSVAERGPGRSYRSWRMDPDTGEQTPLDLPSDTTLLAPMPGSDERAACLRWKCTDNGLAGRFREQKIEAELITTGLAKFDPTTVIAEAWPLTPSAVFPDGKRWLRAQCGKVAVHTAGEKEPKKWAGGKYVQQCVLRPDGKRVAYTFSEWKDDVKATRWELWTASPDGTAATKVIHIPAAQSISHIDWR